uniref:Uncharacterized protein n=1 Tax=Arundo donax TaxID=35708 RepID=A0A0A9BGQ4_ARUDO
MTEVLWSLTDVQWEFLKISNLL